MNIAGRGNDRPGLVVKIDILKFTAQKDAN